MNKTSNFNAEDLSNSDALDQFIKKMKKDLISSEKVSVSLKQTGEINLPQFNSLVSLYVYMSRIGKNFRYHHIGPSVKRFADLTQFQHVFNR